MVWVLCWSQFCVPGGVRPADLGASSQLLMLMLTEDRFLLEVFTMVLHISVLLSGTDFTLLFKILTFVSKKRVLKCF